jgi:hypothetical protein
MLPEFQTVLSYFQAQAYILRRDYGDILDAEIGQLVDEFIDAATNLCQNASPKSLASVESSQSPSRSAETQTVGMESEVESLPEIVMEFHRWAQGPPPPWLQEFEQFHSKMARPATEFVTSADIESVTEPDTEFERLLRSKTPMRAESVTQSDTESVTEPDTDFERLLRSKICRPTTDSSVTEPDTESEQLHHSRTQRRAESITAMESSLSPSRSAETQSLGMESEVGSLPEIVMGFHRWAQGPPPPWLQEFEQFHSKMARPAIEFITEADMESVTEPDTESERLLPSKTQPKAEYITESDTESVTEPDTEFEWLLPSKTRRPTTSSVTEPGTEYELLLPSKTQLRAGSITESDTGSVAELDTEFEQRIHSKIQTRVESVTEPDTDSEPKNFCPNITQPRTETITNVEYSLYRAAPAKFTTTITQMIDQLVCSSASRTMRELRALASGAEFCCIMFLFMLVFIPSQINGRNACGPENESDFDQVVKLSARRLFEALDHLQAFVAVCFSFLNSHVNNVISDSINRVCNYSLWPCVSHCLNFMAVVTFNDSTVADVGGVMVLYIVRLLVEIHFGYVTTSSTAR